MASHREEVNRLAEEFESCQKILIALGDENRQHLMLEMMRMEHCGGIRVGTITEETNLSCRISSFANIKRCRHFESAQGRNKKLLLL